MMPDPQINPVIVFPVLIALLIMLVAARLMRMDSRIPIAIALVMLFVIIFFLISRTPIF